MSQFKTAYVPVGSTLQIVTDAYSSGTYTRLGNPGGTNYTPTAITASADVTIGPFSEARSYLVDVLNNGVTLTVAPASVITSAEIDYVAGVTSDIQTQLNTKAPTAAPTFTGAVVLPSTTTIGSVSSTEVGYLDGVTSALQAQIDSKRASVDTISIYSSDGAIAIANGIAKLTKASAGAYTLADPVVGDDGKVIVLISRTNAAHVVTTSSSINDGIVGGAKTTATFPAFAGASITLMAIDTKWQVISNNNVVVA